MNKFESLRYFCMVSETLNFRETARRLSVSPQVVTRIISELEEELDELLFKRNTRNVMLTPFGENFLPNARSLLAESEKLFTKNKSQKNEMKGTVSITVPPLLDHDSILKELIRKLNDYPDIILDWRVDVHTADLIKENIDIGLRIGINPDPNFIIKQIGIIEEVIVASPILIDKLGLPKQINDLEQYPLSGLINLKTGRMWRWHINADTQFTPHKPSFITADTKSELVACLSGKTCSLLPKNICLPYIKNKELQIIFPKLTMPKWPLYIYRPYQTITTERVLKVFDLLAEIVLSN